VEYGEGLEPRFGGSWLGVTKAIRKLVRSAFCSSKDTFDAVPIPVAFVLESKSVTVECRLQPRCGIDEKDRVVGEMFVAEVREEHLGQCFSSRRMESYMEQAVRIGVDGGVQPVLLVTDLNHSFVERNVIRICTISRL
jgi:hypothetical protein